MSTPVLLALYEGRTDEAQRLAAAGALSLPEAAALGAIDAGRAQLDSGASADDVSPDGWPSLHLAAYFGQVHMVALLIERGASVNSMATSAQGNSALHAALAGRGDDAVVNALLDAGANVNAPDVHQVRPVHLAAARGNLNALARLIAHGARLDVRLADGASPADVARQRGHDAAAAWIEQHTATGPGT